MQSCIDDAFWRRSVPSAVITMGIVNYYLKKQSSNKAYSRFGRGVIVMGASCLAYHLGKISYMVGESCMDTFIEQVGYRFLKYITIS